jgi:hypothetical protein
MDKFLFLGENMPQFSELYTRPQSFYPQKGEYDPGQAFQAFLEHTDQKDCYRPPIYIR